MGDHATESGRSAQPAGAAAVLDPAAISSARWFAGKGREIADATPADALAVPGGDGASLLLVDVTSTAGDVERYLVPVSRDGALLEAEACEHALWPALAHCITSGGRIEGVAGAAEARPGTDAIVVPPGARGLTTDQSNTSVVLGESLVLKCYRRLEPGTHPEPEVLAALSGIDCGVAPSSAGSLVYRDREGRETDLALLYGYVDGTPVGWEAIIASLTARLGSPDAEALVEEAGALAAAAAALHVALGEALGVVRASADDAARLEDDALRQLDEALAVLAPDDPLHALSPHARRRLQGLRRLAGAPLTRVHGDLHVAQFVRSPHGLVAVDFEGEPGRPLEQRRLRTSPLRDLACLLLSLDHVAVAAARRHAFEPAMLAAAQAWSTAAREHALERYAAATAGIGLVVDRDLLRAFEVEKECRELLYAATVLPEWLYAPQATLRRLLGGT